MMLQKKFFLIILILLPIIASSNDRVLTPLYQTPITWTDDQGHSVSLDNWQGKYTIITMAYGSCRKFCPLTLSRLMEIQQLFDKRKVEAEFIIISYDPINDTWKSWAEYRKVHHLERTNWHFLTGSQEDTKTISQMLGMDFWLYDDHIMHNFKIIRLSPDGNIEKTLNWDNKEQIESLIPLGQ